MVWWGELCAARTAASESVPVTTAGQKVECRYGRWANDTGDDRIGHLPYRGYRFGIRHIEMVIYHIDMVIMGQ